MDRTHEIENKTVFLTGGAGFIGSALIGRFIERNRIIVYDNLIHNALEATPYAKHPNLTLVEGDVLDYEPLGRAMEGADLVVHCAAIAGIDAVIRSPVSTMRVNLLGTSHMLEAASQLEHCERVVCFSTSEVFGTEAFHSSEDDKAIMGQVGEARWTYAVSKLAGEHLAIAYYQEKGLPTTVVRPFNVYGPGQIGEGALRTFVIRALRDEPIEIHGDGTQIRAWCYIDDLVDALVCLMTNARALGESFNIGNQTAIVTVFGLASTVIRVLQSSSRVVFVRKNYADVELRVPSVRKAREVLGFTARIDLEEGIRRTAEFFRQAKP